MRTRLRARRSVAALLGLSVSSVLAGMACGDSGSTTGAPSGASSTPLTSSAASSARPSPSPSAEPSPSGSAGGDIITPVYPRADGPPLADAVRYCKAVQELPAKRVSECCTGMPNLSVLFSSECARMLSYAMNHDGVTLASTDLDACERAVTDDLQGCDWAGAAEPPLPAACVGILHGALEEGKGCRSTLECKSGLICDGLSAVDAGKCGPRHTDHVRCNVSTDPLAVIARQDESLADHSVCAGPCVRGRCESAVAEGGACKADAECAAGWCEKDHCTSKPLPKLGESCAAGRCAIGSRCTKDKQCVGPKKEGDECSEDAECRNACVRPDSDKSKDAKGHCERSCPTLNVPNATPSAAPSSKPSSKPTK